MLTQPEPMSASVTTELCDRHLIEHRLPGMSPHLFSGQTIHKESLLQNNQAESPLCPTPDAHSEAMTRKSQRLSSENTAATNQNKLGSWCRRNCVTSHTVLLVQNGDQPMNGMWGRLNLVVSLEASTAAEGRSPRCPLQNGPHRGPRRAGGQSPAQETPATLESLLLHKKTGGGPEGSQMGAATGRGSVSEKWQETKADLLYHGVSTRTMA